MWNLYQEDKYISPMSTSLNTRISAENGTAGTTNNTKTNRAQTKMPSIGQERLKLSQQASHAHAKEMTQDSFTLVSRDKTYAAIVCEQPQKQSAERNGQAAKERMQFQKVTGKTNNKDTAKVAANTRKVAGSPNDATESVTIRGTLTMAIGSQVILTKVTLPELEKERKKALFKAIDTQHLCEALSKALGIKKQEGRTGGPTKAPLSSLPYKHPKATTLGCGVDQASPISDVEQTLLDIKTSSLSLDAYPNIQAIMAKVEAAKKIKPATAAQVKEAMRCLTKEMFVTKQPATNDKKTCICYHCNHKGHYSVHCHTKKKEKKAILSAMVQAIKPLSDNNCYKELCKETLDTPMPPVKLLVSDLKTRITENKQIRKLTVERYNERQRTEIAKELCNQLKMLLVMIHPNYFLPPLDHHHPRAPLPYQHHRYLKHYQHHSLSNHYPSSLRPRQGRLCKWIQPMYHYRL